MRGLLKSFGFLTAIAGLLCAFLAYASLLPDPCQDTADPHFGLPDVCCAEDAPTSTTRCDAEASGCDECESDCQSTSSCPCTTLCCSGLVAGPVPPFALCHGIASVSLPASTDREPRTVSTDPLLRPPIAA